MAENSKQLLDLMTEALLQPLGLLVVSNDPARLKVALQTERIKAINSGKDAMVELSFRLGPEAGQLLLLCQKKQPGGRVPKSARLRELTRAWENES